MARLLQRCGSAAQVYEENVVVWREAHPQLSDAAAASLAKGPDLRAWGRLMEECEALGITVTAPQWPGYPEVFGELEAPPPLLYMRGTWHEADARAVAIVGTRSPTAYGREAARVFARELAFAGHTVVSGLALGIDAVAHHGALQAGGRTIAVIGCGLDIDYPIENRDIRARIEASEGAQGIVMSEFPPGTQAWPSHFPRRNRLISALARAVVVVEAGGKSGALLTADHARAQKRLLFAVPGPVFSTMSAGTNALLGQGARLASRAADVIEMLEAEPADLAARGTPPRAPGLRKKPKTAVKTRSVSPRAVPAPAPAPAADPVLNLWGPDEACPLDTLAARAEEQGVYPPGRAASALLESLLLLELRGLVRRMPGAQYVKTHGGR
jgi:DNA processing protein